MDFRPDRTRVTLFLEAFRTWVPIIVSLCAISLTVFQAVQSRRHTRLSVQPRVDWTIQIDDEGDIDYSLVNNGFGPAILTRLDLRIDGVVVGPDGLETCARISAMLGRDPALWKTSCFDMEGDLVIRAGDRVRIYGSNRLPGNPGLGRPVTRDDYARLTPVGRYCSFYDDCWTLE